MTAPESADEVIVEGCITREADVPGRQPNIAERAGIMEDYILTDAKVVKGTPPADAPSARPGPQDEASRTSRATMFEVDGIADADLKQHVGKRVQIQGTFANVDRMMKRPAEPQDTADELAEIRGVQMRPVAGSCPAAQ
jgi:hypothetical protein